MLAPVSVIIPTYRDGEALQRALTSVENQTLLPSQILVVDDASADSNAERICKTSKLENIRVISLEENVGPGGARNAGIAASREPFVAFLDADDEWHPEKLERQMSIMLEPGAPLLSCHEKSFNGTSWPKLDDPARISSLRRSSMLFSNCAPISTVVIKKDAIRYEFPHTYASEDYVFVAANLLSGVPSAVLHQTLARADKNAFGSGGLSGRLHAMQRGEMRARNFLLSEGLINRLDYTLALVWSLLKYFRRVAIVSFRRIGNAI